MMQLKGKSVFKGIAVGPVLVLRQEEQKVRRSKVDDPDAEMERIRQAVSTAQEQLQKLYDKAVAEVGEASAAIFEVHQMMLEDEDYLDAINNMIQTELVGAEYAVAVTGDNFSEMFAGMDDEYMRARAADVKDISNRLIQCLSGNGENGFELREPSIIVADDLSPSETVQMDKQKILAIVTVHGSANSHTSILARMMNIPALIGVPMDLEKISSGMKAVVDGMQGEVIFEPDELACMEAEKKIEKEKEKLRLLQELKGKENATLSGKKVNVYANIGGVGDVGYVLENDAGGIG
ncbi:MAG: phosphoenolpyruvate--protein phosphotransferase, partial [Lachnospiraceae bacterium]|nr:phosphoenolpyruvate--protein phosphotransferase [Lachnospiraceae bacterium]